MKTSKTLSTSVVTLSESTGSSGMLRRACGMLPSVGLGTFGEVEDALHGRPPFGGAGLGRPLLQRGHERVPASRDRVLVDAREVPRWIERVVSDQVHEHAAPAQKDLHLLHTAVAQARGDLRPDLLVVAAVLV